MFILSFVSTREAVQTCILSKRWINTWASVQDLKFEIKDFRLPKFLDGERAAEEIVIKFKLFVKNVLEERETSCVKIFQLLLAYGFYFPCTAVADCIGDVMKLGPREWLDKVVKVGLYIMTPPSSIKRNKDLPDHLIYQNILPRLPFKCLNRCKCISKEMYSLISTDAKFAADQSCLADTSSSGFVYMTCSRLSFFSNNLALVGVPDPSLNFLNPTNNSREIKLVSSTNGLLLLYGEFRGMMSLCVCNPATKDAVFVPNVVEKKYFCAEMGLVYDPCELPDQFTIVDPLSCYKRDGIMYRFDIFHSDTGKWTRSSQSIYINTIFEARKALCMHGLIYWYCGKYLLWYDVKRDIAGSLLLPVNEGNVTGRVTDIGIYSGEITCCRVWSGGINVWRLTGGSHWGRIHAVSWDVMVDALDFWLGMQLRNKSMSDILFYKQHIRPVGFDGQFVYIALRMRYQDKTELLFSWETETGRVEKKGVITTWHAYQTFNYANSMARVPQIFNATF